MNFGLVGLGNWGKNYVNISLNRELPDFNIVKFCSKQPKSLISPDFWTGDYKEVIKSDIETVIIATQPCLHFEIAKLALESNKNVICEKPCMFSKQEFDEIRALCDKTGKIFYTNYINQFASVVSRIKGLNEFNNGKLNLINIGNGPVRGYSALWDYGCHEIFLALYLNRELSKYNWYVRGIDKSDGRFSFILHLGNLIANISVGNTYTQRVKSISFSCRENNLFWIDEKKEKLLTVMLEQFIAGKLKTNLDFSVEISNIINTIENFR